MAGNSLPFEPLAPSADAALVTPSDAGTITPTRGLYVGVTGDVAVRMTNGAASILFKAVPAGTTLNVSVNRVYATNTTATNLVALY